MKSPYSCVRASEDLERKLISSSMVSFNIISKVYIHLPSDIIWYIQTYILIHMISP